MELLARKHSSLGSVNIAASSSGLFLDRDFVWHVVVALQVKGVFSVVFTFPVAQLYDPPLTSTFMSGLWLSIHQSVLRSIHLKTVAEMVEKHSCEELISEEGRGVL